MTESREDNNAATRGYPKRRVKNTRKDQSNVSTTFKTSLQSLLIVKISR